jgi:hypothetical protein
MPYTNGNGSTTAGPRVLNGRGLGNRRLDKRQRAVLAADIIDGVVTLQLSAQQAAQVLDVSVSYVALAQRLSPEKRKAILAGGIPCRCSLHPARRLALPAPTDIDDATLVEVIRTVGIDRALAAAVEVEHS